MSMAPRITFTDFNVAEIVAKLGLSEDAILQSSDADLKAFVPATITQAELLLINIAKRNQLGLYEAYHKVVGRIDAEWDMPNGEHVTQHGTCIVCSGNGSVTTAEHTILCDGLTRSFKAFVSLPAKQLTYEVEIVKKIPKWDFAMLRPLQPLQGVQYFSEWAMHPPPLLSKVFLISFPDVLDDEFPSRRSEWSGPSIHEGKIAYVHGHEAIANYVGYGGSSGGLVIGFGDNNISFCGMHVGIMHESAPLQNLDVGALNEALGHKCASGNYIFNVGALVGDVNPTTTLLDRMRKRPGKQVVRKVRKGLTRFELKKRIKGIVIGLEDLQDASKHESVEEIDLFDDFLGSDDLDGT